MYVLSLGSSGRHLSFTLISQPQNFCPWRCHPCPYDFHGDKDYLLIQSLERLDNHLPTPTLAARAEVCALALPPRATHAKTLLWELVMLNPRTRNSVIAMVSFPAWFQAIAPLRFLPVPPEYSVCPSSYGSSFQKTHLLNSTGISFLWLVIKISS